MLAGGGDYQSGTIQKEKRKWQAIRKTEERVYHHMTLAIQPCSHRDWGMAHSILRLTLAQSATAVSCPAVSCPAETTAIRSLSLVHPQWLLVAPRETLQLWLLGN